MKIAMASAVAMAMSWTFTATKSSAFSTVARRAIGGTKGYNELFPAAFQHSPLSGNNNRRNVVRSMASSTAAPPNTSSSNSAEEAADAEDTSIYAREADELGKLKSPFLCTLRDRGFLHQCTNILDLDEHLQKSLDNPDENGIVSAYLGFDATADSLHVGSLLQIMILRHLQKSGHKPIVLIGGGTSKVGDPTGKDESRRLLTDDVIKQNTEGISSVFAKFLSFQDGDAADVKTTEAFMVDNDEWLSELKYLEFLRDYGTEFTINRMLSFESVKQRLAREAPFSFLEFNYMILQGYDYLELYRRYGVSLQLGGADQWGNILSGVELGRRKDSARLFGLTAPLITTSDGKKMGKTEGGAMWLNADKLSEYDYWQFWRNTADQDVIRFMKLFTEVSLEDIEELSKLEGADINQAKVRLADETTAMLHGKECLPKIHETIKSMFAGGGGGGGGAASMDSLPRIYVTSEDVAGDGKRFADLFLELGLASSKKDARRLIAGGGARMGDNKIAGETAALTAEDFGDEKEITLRAGKKRAGVVELQG